MHYLATATTGEAKVLLTLFIMLVSAKLMAELFERLRQPAVAGEILAGVLIGPSLLALTAPSEIIDLLAEIGVIFLLFTVGLETNQLQFSKLEKRVAIVAIRGVVAPHTCYYTSCPKAEKLRSGQGTFIFGLVLCLGLSVAATYIGVAAIIGAFLAGMALGEVAEDTPRMHRQMSGVTEFLVPFFLVNIGMKLNLGVFRPSSVIILCVLIALVQSRPIAGLWPGSLKPRRPARCASRNGNGAEG